MWQFVFYDKTLLSDFVELLIAEGALAEESRSSFESVSSFISLYALNIMHGARLKMADGKMAQLRLAASEEFGFLRIKAEIRSEEHTSEIQSLMRISYAVFCLKKKNIFTTTTYYIIKSTQ